MIKHLYEFDDFRLHDVNKKMPELETSLIAFSQVTDIPISFFTCSGQLIWCTGEDKKICMANAAYGQDGFSCTANLIS